MALHMTCCYSMMLDNTTHTRPDQVCTWKMWPLVSHCRQDNLPLLLQVSRTFASAGGTVAAARAALAHGLKMTANVAGGTHHAFRDK